MERLLSNLCMEQGGPWFDWMYSFWCLKDAVESFEVQQPLSNICVLLPMLPAKPHVQTSRIVELPLSSPHRFCTAAALWVLLPSLYSPSHSNCHCVPVGASTMSHRVILVRFTRNFSSLDEERQLNVFRYRFPLPSSDLKIVHWICNHSRCVRIVSVHK